MKTEEQTSVSAEIFRISLQPYMEQVIEVQAVLFGSRPALLFSLVALLDIVLIISYIYNMGFFALMSLCLLIAYLLSALYFRFKGILEKKLFPEQNKSNPEQQQAAFNQICEYLAKVQTILSTIASYLFEGKLGAGPLRILFTAGIWLGIILVLNYFGSFWFIFVLLNIFLLAPCIIRMIQQKQPTPEITPREVPKLEETGQIELVEGKISESDSDSGSESN